MEWLQHPQTKLLLKLLYQAAEGTCLDWGSGKFEHEVPETARMLTDKARGAVQAIGEITVKIVDPEYDFVENIQA